MSLLDTGRSTAPDDELKALFAGELERVRARSLGLTTDVLDVDELLAQHSRLMSPLVWDLAHVGNYEELWLLRAAAGVAPMRPELDDIYDAFEHPRLERPTLPLLPPAEAQAHIGTVRTKVLDALDRLSLDPSNPLLDRGLVYAMVVQHEHMHDETMLATHQLRRGAAVLAELPPPPGDAALLPTEALVPAGTFPMGTSHDGWAYDNERPAHEVFVPAFHIDTTPVANRAYLSFVEARWAGRRLPTEPEWEKAASWDPVAPRKRRFPWGDDDPTEAHANLGQRHYQPAPVGAYPEGASAYGLRQLMGDVWEWTSSGVDGYPGYRPFPYREYSEVFFGGDYRVLRGGSWATDRTAVRATFRNWDHPIRRQIFSGFRCARDAAPGEGV
jgi:iron(II)-dependent oxidoreductase